MTLHLGVCLGSNIINNPKHRKTAFQFLDWVGRKDIDIIFSGSRSGLMRYLEEKLVLYRKTITGIVNFELSKQIKIKNFSELIISKNSNDRIDKFIHCSDCFVFLVTWIERTYDVFDILIKKVSNETSKQLFLINTDNFWTLLKNFIKYLQKEGLLNKECTDYNIHFCNFKSFKKKFEKEENAQN
tara:strand:- start:92 stop:646 length:555 start_codon:yes stop_codon:yes gene_type:complete